MLQNLSSSSGFQDRLFCIKLTAVGFPSTTHDNVETATDVGTSAFPMSTRRVLMLLISSLGAINQRDSRLVSCPDITLLPSTPLCCSWYIESAFTGYEST